MIHHVLLEVQDLERSAYFYDGLLGPLGWRRHLDEDDIVGWGIAKPVFFIASNHEPAARFGLISFNASGIAAVKAAHEGGTRSGGTSVSPPGESRGLTSGSYSAFLQDPDGHDVEVTVGAD